MHMRDPGLRLAVEGCESCTETRIRTILGTIALVRSSCLVMSLNWGA